MSVIFIKMAGLAPLWHLTHGFNCDDYETWESKYSVACIPRKKTSALIDELQSVYSAAEMKVFKFCEKNEALALQLGL